MFDSKPFVILLVFVALLFSALTAGARQIAGERSRSAPGRVAPPETLSCDRNRLTSYNGVVTAYRRDKATTRITIYTEWDTREVVELSHADEGSPLSFYRLLGSPFTENDWSRIESPPGVLIEGTRIIAWVCSDGDVAPVIDWRPVKDLNPDH